MGGRAMRVLPILGRTLLALGAVVALACAGAVALEFPWSVDPQADQSSSAPAVEFYRNAYAAKPAAGSASQDYVEFTRRGAAESGVPELVAGFVKRHRLEKAKVLEVGAGSGLLQDLVADYTA